MVVVTVVVVAPAAVVAVAAGDIRACQAGREAVESLAAAWVRTSMGILLGSYRLQPGDR